eukprot:11989460-Ditylum_brightwellii.AAC.1
MTIEWHEVQTQPENSGINEEEELLPSLDSIDLSKFGKESTVVINTDTYNGAQMFRQLVGKHIITAGRKHLHK